VRLCDGPENTLVLSCLAWLGRKYERRGEQPQKISYIHFTITVGTCFDTANDIVIT
jgi:hypothetical protein